MSTWGAYPISTWVKCIYFIHDIFYHLHKSSFSPSGFLGEHWLEYWILAVYYHIWQTFLFTDIEQFCDLSQILRILVRLVKTNLLLLQLQINSLSKLDYLGHLRSKLHGDLILWKHDLEI